MARIVTRTHLMDRYRRDTRRASDKDVDIRYRLVEAWAMIWYRLSTGDFGIGPLRADTPVVTASDSWDFPSDYLSLTSLTILSSAGSSDRSTPIRTSWQEVDERRLDQLSGGLPQFYLIQGPDNSGSGSPASQRLRFFPGLSVGQVVRLTYVCQEPSLGDPAVPGDDTASIDVLNYMVEDALVSLARLRGAAPEDNIDYQRAAQTLMESLADALQSGMQRDTFGTNSVDRYMSGGGWSGY